METRIQTDPKLPALGKKLLTRLHSKELTMEAFEKECAFWMLDTLEDMHWRPNPTMPAELRTYFDKKRDDPGYHLSREFWEQPHIKQYKAMASEINALNKSNWYWLNRMSRLIPKEDLINQHKIRKIMNGFPLKTSYE